MNPVTGSMLYFAYGSNMYLRQIRNRCPSACFVCIAMLNYHLLAFTRMSPRWGGGVADVIPSDGNQVWGVVYEIRESEITSLDRSEGYRPGRPLEENDYVREERTVYTNGHVDQPQVVSLYCANRQVNPPLPSEKYKRQIIDGARYWSLPAAYIDQLEHIRSSYKR